MKCANCDTDDAVVIARSIPPGDAPLCVKCTLGWVQEWIYASLNPGMHHGDKLSAPEQRPITLSWRTE